MATQDTSKEDEVLDAEDSEVETSQEEDELTTEDENDSNEETEDSDDDDSEDEDDDESETSDDDDPEFKKRFTQFKGDSYEEYVPELEKAYGNALGKLTRLTQEDKGKQAKIDAVMAAAAKDPEFAARLNDLMGDDAQEVTVEPAILKARQDMEATMEKEYNDFLDAHPELGSDPQLAEEVITLVKEFGATARKGGKIMGMGDALKKAWAYLDLDDNPSEKIVAKAKEVASKPKTGNNTKKPAKKTDFTDEQLKVAKKWGVELKTARSSQT